MAKKKSIHKYEKYLPRVNNILSVVVFVLAIYIIATPFIPELELLFRSRTEDTSGYVYKTDSAINAGVDESKLKPPPEGNRIVIPAIQVNSEILEGDDISILNNGQSWRRPKTSSPEKGGNTVVVGHRFFQQGKNTFYHLNKLTPGETVILFWDGDEYEYVVKEVFETTPENISIENNTSEKLLTLYTCSGLSAEKRFVVQAVPVKS